MRAGSIITSAGRVPVSTTSTPKFGLASRTFFREVVVTMHSRDNPHACQILIAERAALDLPGEDRGPTVGHALAVVVAGTGKDAGGSGFDVLAVRRTIG